MEEQEDDSQEGEGEEEKEKKGNKRWIAQLCSSHTVLDSNCSDLEMGRIVT